MTMQISPIWIAVVVLLWAIPLAAYAIPAVMRDVAGVCRQKGNHLTLFIFLALVAAIYAFPSRAEKGGGTNIPPATVEGTTKTIRLYYTGSNGHLVPLGAEIRKANQ